MLLPKQQPLPKPQPKQQPLPKPQPRSPHEYPSATERYPRAALSSSAVDRVITASGGAWLESKVKSPSV